MAKAKFDIKTVQTEAQKSAQRAFHAGVGVTDLAVEVVRDYTAGAQKRIVSLQKSVTTFEPKALRTQAAKDAKARRVAIEKLVAQLQSQLQSEAVAVPAKVQKAIDANVEAATDTYGDLVKRGESLVGRIRRQQSTQDTVAAEQDHRDQGQDHAYPGHQGGQEDHHRRQEVHDRGQEAHHDPALQREGHRDLRQEDRVGRLARPHRRRRQGRRLIDHRWSRRAEGPSRDHQLVS